MFKRILAIAGLFVVLLSACQSASAPKDAGSRSAVPEGGAAVPAQPVEARGVPSNSGIQSSVPAVSTDRVVINNATISIVVDDPIAGMNQIAKLAVETGGFVVSSNLSKKIVNDNQEVPITNISIRVPAEKLDDSLEKIRRLVKNPKTDILNENKTGQDVTEKYTDLKSRLTNLENAEKQLQKIMDSATKTEDVLSVYNRLIQIREQIEVIKGQIRYYDQSAALSLINVTLESTESIKPLTIGTWQPVGIALSAIQALINVLKFLAGAAIWIVLFFIPLILVIYIPLRLLWLGVKRLRKNRKNQISPPVQQPPVS